MKNTILKNLHTFAAIIGIGLIILAGEYMVLIQIAEYGGK